MENQKGVQDLPVLNVLRGEELINCAVLIVRYFGGIKLGTGGMARAYALAVKEVLKEAELVPYEKEVIYVFSTNYNEVDRTLYRLKQLGLTNYERDFGVDKVVWKLSGSEEKIEEYKGRKRLKCLFVNIIETLSLYNASSSSSSVLIRMVLEMSDTNILPSPILPVFAAPLMASIALLA